MPSQLPWICFYVNKSDKFENSRWHIFCAILGWQQYLQVGVVDCSDEKNVDVCRQYEISAYPTIKVRSFLCITLDCFCKINKKIRGNSLNNFVCSFLMPNLKPGRRDWKFKLVVVTWLTSKTRWSTTCKTILCWTFWAFSNSWPSRSRLTTSFHFPLWKLCKIFLRFQ